MRTTARLANLDALRALAVVLVMAQHLVVPIESYATNAATPLVWVPTGALGVNLFFMISGFCIFMTLERARDVRTFLVKRVSRLYPAYAAAVLLTFALMMLAPLPGWDLGWRDLAANLLWINMTKVMPHVDTVYWSLAVELKFYVLLAVLAWWRRGQVLPWFGALSVVAGVLWALADWAAWRPGLLIANNIFVATALPYFLMGMVLYARWQGQLNRPTALAWLSVALMLSAITSAQHALWYLLMPLVWLALLGVALKCPAWWVPRWVLWVGFVSYPLYLVHQFIGLRVMLALADFVPIAGQIMAAAGVSLALAWLLAAGVEHRWRAPLERLLLRGKI